MAEINNAPKLRFSDFKSEYIKKEFGDIVNKANKSYNPTKDSTNFPCVELESLSQKTGILIKTFNSIDLKSNKTKFKSGDVLFGKLRPYLQKFLLPNFDGVCTSEIWVFQPTETTSAYLFYLIQTTKFNFEANITTGSKMPRADWEYVSSIKYSLPSLPEQEKIANFLTAVDTKIATLTKKKTLLEQYKKGVMQQLFTHPSTGSGQELRFKGFHDKVTYESLEHKIDLISGYSFKGDEISEDETGTPILRGINITEGRIRHNKEIDRYYIGDKSKLEKFLLREGDLVIGMDGSKVGKNAAIISEHDAGSILIQRVARIRAKENSNINFIYQNILSNSFRRYVDVVNTSSGIPHISSKQIKDYKVLSPSKEEQTKIANFLTAIDQKIEATNAQIESTTTFKKGLLQQLFV